MKKKKQKKVAVVGAGFVGLAAAWDLAKTGAEVTIYESNNIPGGLASGFTTDNWNWSLEKHYHHIFKTDDSILNWIDEVGISDLVYFSDTNSSLILNNKLYQLDSPLSLIKFSPISIVARIRTGIVLAFLKLFPKGEILEKYTAQDFLISTMGKQSWEVIWKPLFYGKFGVSASKVNAAWFWSRIHARSKQLGYFKGGFLNLVESACNVLRDHGVIIEYNSFINKVKVVDDEVSLTIKKAGKTKSISKKFDQVLVTTPSSIFLSMAKGLPSEYRSKYGSLEGLGAMTLILELESNFFEDGIYWLNINENKWPFLAVVEHTNFVDKKQYGDKSIVYVGKYLSKSDKLFSLNKTQLLKKYKPYLEKLSPGFSKKIKNMWLYKEKFAQPVVGINHGKKVPKIYTPLNGVYWASMQHVYPWDRGVNFAVDIGRQAAKKMNE